MPHPDQTRFDISETVTVFVVALDGAILDVIEDVDLGDAVEAALSGRTSLKAAALWGWLASQKDKGDAEGSGDFDEGINDA